MDAKGGTITWHLTANDADFNAAMLRTRAEARRTGRAVDRDFGKGMKSARLSLEDFRRDLGRSAQLFRDFQIALRGFQMTSLIIGVATAGGAIIELVGALAAAAGAIYALPSVIASGIGAFATFKTAISGVGDAFKSVLKGDIEKLQEQLAKLSPEARGFVTSFANVNEAFKPIKDAVQEAFFQDLGKQMESVAKTTLPVLKIGMVDLATAMNGMAKEAARVAQEPFFQNMIADSLKTTADATDILTRAVEPLAQSLAGLVKIGQPYTIMLAEWIVDLSKSAAGYINSAEGQKQLTAAIDLGISALKRLGNLIGAVFDLFVALFKVSNKEGSSFLGTLTDLINKMTDWVNSAKGQELLIALFQATNTIFKELASTAGEFIVAILELVKAYNDLDGPIKDVITKLIVWSAIMSPLITYVSSMAASFKLVLYAGREVFQFLGVGLGALGVKFGKFSGLLNKLGSVSLLAGGRAGLGAVGSTIASIFAPLGKPEVLRGAASAALIGVSIIALAVGINQVSKMNFDLGKMILLGATVVAMSAVLSIVGKFTAQVIPGLIAAAAVAASLVILAGAIAVANRAIPSDIGSFAAKMANLAIAVTGMTVIVGILGALVSTGIGALVAGAGLATVIGLAAGLIAIAVAIGKVNKEVPNNIRAVKTKIEAIADIIAYIGKTNMGNLIANAVNAINIGLVATMVSNYTSIASNLNKIASIELNKEKIASKVKFIRDTVEYIGKSDGNSIFGQILSTVSNFIALVDVSIISKVVDVYYGIAKKLGEIQSIQLNKEAIASKIIFLVDTVKFISDMSPSGAIGGLTALINSFIQATTLTNIGKIVDTYYSIADKLNTIQDTKLNQEAIKAAIIKLTEVVKFITNMGGGSWYESLYMAINTGLNATAVENVGRVIKVYADIIGSLEKIKDMKLDIAAIRAKIAALTSIIKYVMDTKDGGGLFATIGNLFTGGSISDKQVGQVQSIINKMSEIANTVNRIPVLASDVYNRISTLRNIIYQIGQINEVANIGNKEYIVGMSQSILNKMSEMAGTILLIPIVGGDRIALIQTLRNAVWQVVQINEGVGDLALKAQIVSSATGMLRSLHEFATTLASLPNIGNQVSMIATLVGAVNQLAAGITANGQKLYISGSSLVTQLVNGIRSQLGSVTSAGLVIQSTLWNAIQSKMIDEYYQGAALAGKLIQGIRSNTAGAGAAGAALQGSMWHSIQAKMDDEYYQGRALANKLAEGIRAGSSGAYGAGANATQGFINGAYSKDVYSVGWQIASRFLQGLKDRGRQGSPWKETAQIGIFAGEGFLEGIMGQESGIVSAAESIADGVIGAFTKVNDFALGMETDFNVSSNLNTAGYSSELSPSAISDNGRDTVAGQGAVI